MPAISVILPVYNGEHFLKEAIDSILQQTFTDFELIIINDGSTDGSERIIQSYKDERIVYLKNEANKGLIFSLNRMVDIAAGNFIARMDADDVALPERLKKQAEYLQQNDVALVATRVKLIDDTGKLLPDWIDDKRTTTRSQVKSFLRKDNCIAHPSVLVKSSVLKTYKYRGSQKYSEDYDLWLRLVADGLVIAKIDEPLLLYRILPTSATRFKKINVFLRLAKVKFKFVFYQLTHGKISAYVLSVLMFAFLDIIKATGKEIKSVFKK